MVGAAISPWCIFAGAVSGFVVLVVAVATIRLANRPVWFELIGGPYSGEYVYLDPDTTAYVTSGTFGDVEYVRCGLGHLHHGKTLTTCTRTSWTEAK